MRKAHNRLDIDSKYIATEYKNGKTAQTIATELGVSKKSVLLRLKEEGVECRQPPTYPEVTGEVLNEYYINKKLSSRTIASIFGCSSRLIIKRLEHFGIPTRQNAGDPSFTEDERKEKYGNPREKHSLWKGGVTGINETLRGATEEWRNSEMKRNNYTCYISGVRKGTMHVHHITPFHEIRDIAFVETNLTAKPTLADYTDEEVTLLRDKVVELHQREKGYVLTSELHKRFHSLYGFKTTESDLHEFKTRYRLGELNESVAI